MANGTALDTMPDYVAAPVRRWLTAFAVPVVLAILLTGALGLMVALALLGASTAMTVERALAYLTTVVLERSQILYVEELCSLSRSHGGWRRRATSPRTREAHRVEAPREQFASLRASRGTNPGSNRRR